jgi:hypothetical protein
VLVPALIPDGGCDGRRVKSGVVSAIAYGAGLATASVVGVAVAPLGVMFVVALGVGVGLNWLDNHYQIKEEVLKAFKSLPKDIVQGIYRLPAEKLNQVESLKREMDRQLVRVLKQTADKAAEVAVNAFRKQIEQLLQSLLVPRM